MMIICNTLLLQILLLQCLFDQAVSITHEEEEEYVKVLVGFRDRQDQQQYVRKSRRQPRTASGKPKTKIKYEYQTTEVVAMEVTRAELEEMRKDGSIDYIEEDFMVPLAQNDDDEDGPQELTSYGIGLTQAHRTFTPDPTWDQQCGVYLCVVDSGVFIDNADIPYSRGDGYVDGKSFDDAEGEEWFNPRDSDHGTEVAGIAIAAGGNGRGITGVIPQGPQESKVCLRVAKVVPDGEAAAPISTLMRAAEWCRTQANGKPVVVNISFAHEFESDTERRVYQNLYNQGVLLVSAAGNAGDSTISYPAAHDSVISVGSVNEASRRSGFSQYNNKVELAAPGENIVLLQAESNRLGFGGGTSYAAPFVAGLAARIWSEHPRCTNDEVRLAMRDSARRLGVWIPNREYGYGLLQARDAADILWDTGCNDPNRTRSPTMSPTRPPTPGPTPPPTRPPTRPPTPNPTPGPTPPPTRQPTRPPTPNPTPGPTRPPTTSPSTSPTSSPAPSPDPTMRPTKSPTKRPTMPPTKRPTASPSTSPSASASPTMTPSSNPTKEPTRPPTPGPTRPPTPPPTRRPTREPTPGPTRPPTLPPTPRPTSPPSLPPTPGPTNPPTPPPTPGPTESPSSRPTGTPSEAPPPPIIETNIFPLGLCEGECDIDRDCQEGLLCYQRNSGGAIPGCVGGEDDATNADYCVKEELLVAPVPIPLTAPPTGRPVSAPVSPPSVGPVSAPVSLPTLQPTVSLTVPQTEPPSSSIIQPSLSPTTDPLCVIESNDFPLALCHGDCDNDMDCQQGLLCHQRSSFEAVPGCTCGESDGSASDYCIYPPPPPVIESNNFPLALCEGDCDTDNDCQAGLLCQQRNSGDAVPGCFGGEDDASNNDYCVIAAFYAEPVPLGPPPKFVQTVTTAPSISPNSVASAADDATAPSLLSMFGTWAVLAAVTLVGLS